MEESVRFKPTASGSFNPLSMYPVGSIYQSVLPTDPSELFGGTWQQIKDVFMMAAGDKYAAGSTGGEAQHTLTVEEMPKHRHTANAYNATGGSAWTLMDNSSAFKNGFRDGKDGLIGYTGGNQPHNNLPPYLAVYTWVRVA